MNLLREDFVSAIDDAKAHAPRVEPVKTLTLGVRVLDIATGGLLPNDVTVVAARSGQGKTEYATSIALANALNGSRVFFYALEAERGEIAKRIMYRLYSQLYFEDGIRPTLPLPMRYINFYKNLLTKELNLYRERVDALIEKTLQNISIFYRKTDFTLDTFKSTLQANQDRADLFIVDHLSYFDVDEDKANKEYSEIVKTVRDLALLSSKPIVLVSHVRKRDRRDQSFLPDVEDIFGTSNIYKIATKVILLAPDWSAGELQGAIKTFFHVGKCRHDGSVAGYIARVEFDRNINAYKNGYELGKYCRDIKDFAPIDNPNELPNWARPEWK